MGSGTRGLVRNVTTRFEIASDDGYIYCRQCPRPANAFGPKWCIHMGPYMSSHGDAEMIWFDDWWQDAETKLMIPMFPSVDQWGEVHLVLPDNFEIGLDGKPVWPRLKVHLVRADGISDPEFLAMITPGEGRWVVREILIDRMASWTQQESPVCGNPRHSYMAEVVWSKAMQQYAESPERNGQLWSVFNTGMCVSCVKVIDDTANFDPDLIPEVQKRGVWNPNG